MEQKNFISGDEFYNVCHLIHNITKLDVEFIDNEYNISFRHSSLVTSFLSKFTRDQTPVFIHEYLRNKNPRDVSVHTDHMGLGYMGIGLWDHGSYEGALIIGPFLTCIPDDLFVSRVIETNHFPLGHRSQLSQYFKTLSIIDMTAFKNIGYLIVNLIADPFIHANFLYPENIDFIHNEKNENKLENEKLHSEIELRYTREKQLMNAIQRGSKEEALKIVNLFQFDPTHRVPKNPLRARKNVVFAFSTLLRLAAERGGVSPVYLHNCSDKYAALLEKVSTISELDVTTTAMVSEYCDLVNKSSTIGYSSHIGKVINYINLNFDSPLTLKLLAEKNELSVSHLSRQFRKETSMTITEYINQTRIKEAKFLIEQNESPITDIALAVGFESHNYFCTVFKQITSLTPKEYLRMVNRKE